MLALAPRATGCRRVARQGGEMGRVGGNSGDLPAKPADDTRSSPRGRLSCRSAFLLGAARGVGLGERLLQRLVAEHRALQAGRADVDPEEVEEVVGAEGRDID